MSFPRNIVRLLPWFLGLALLLVAVPALAANPHLVVVAEGANAAEIAESLRGELAPHYAIDDSKAFRKKLGGEWSGDDVRLYEALESEKREAVIAELRRVAAAQNVALIVLMDVHTSKTGRSARVAVVGRHTEPFEISTRFKGKPDSDAEGVKVYGDIEKPLATMAKAEAKAPPDPPPPAEPAAAPPPPPPPPPPTAKPSLTESAAAGSQRDAASDAPPSGDARRIEDAIVVLEPEIGFGMRHFDYKDRLTPNQRPYDLGAAPILGLRGEVYPFATMGNDVLAMFGLAARYDHSVLLQSELSNASSALDPTATKKISTSWSDFDIDLRARVPVTSQVMIGGTAGFGFLDYGFSDTGALASELPSVNYKFIRLGPDTRIRVWKLAITASAEYLVVTDSGALSDRYPHASSGGLDLAAGIAIPFASHFEARTGVRYQRFFHKMNPEPGDANVAGGALDELARWDSSLAYHY